MNIQRFKGRLGAIAVATAFGLVVATGFGVTRLRGDIHSPNEPPSLKLANPDEGPSRNSFAPIVKKVLPEVVNISSTKVVKASNDLSGQMPEGMQMDPFFRQFFGDDGAHSGHHFNAPRNDRERGLGSGVIVSPNGYILTNNHVVEGATEIQVTTSDKHEYKARVVGTDPRTDIAVLKIDATNLPAITIGDSSKMQVGDMSWQLATPSAWEKP